VSKEAARETQSEDRRAGRDTGPGSYAAQLQSAADKQQVVEVGLHPFTLRWPLRL
jgi:hypothetical protein